MPYALSAGVVTLCPSSCTWGLSKHPCATEKTIQRYAACEQAISPKDYADKPATVEDLAALSASFVQKVAEVNKRAWLFRLLCSLPFPFGLPRVAVWLNDLGCAGLLQADRPFLKVEKPQAECEIETTSPNMTYLYQHFSGFNALMVNGRYQATKRGNLKLFVLSHLALMASANVSLSLGYVVRNTVKIIMHAVYRLTKS